MIEKEYQYRVKQQEDKNKKKEERKTDLKRQASLYQKTDDSQQKQGTINESLLSKE
jgi:predicted metal-dependent peptidase